MCWLVWLWLRGLPVFFSTVLTLRHLPPGLLCGRPGWVWMLPLVRIPLDTAPCKGLRKMAGGKSTQSVLDGATLHNAASRAGNPPGGRRRCVVVRAFRQHSNTPSPNYEYSAN